MESKCYQIEVPIAGLKIQGYNVCMLINHKIPIAIWHKIILLKPPTFNRKKPKEN